MKKFGTPSGAGPGSEKENVGFDGVGTPAAAVAPAWCSSSWRCSGAGDCVLRLRAAGPLDLLPAWPCACSAAASGRPLGCRRVAAVAVALGFVLGGGRGGRGRGRRVVVDVVLGAVVVSAWYGVARQQDSVTFVTGGDRQMDRGQRRAGRDVDREGVSCCPLSSVTVTTHVSAEAVGIAAMPAHGQRRCNRHEKLSAPQHLGLAPPAIGVRTSRRDEIAAPYGRYS